MKSGFKWTAVLILVGVAGSLACSSSEPSDGTTDRARDSLGGEGPSPEIPAPRDGAARTDDPHASTTAAAECGGDGQSCCDGTCNEGHQCESGYCQARGQRGQPCCGGIWGVCAAGSRCNGYTCDAPCGALGEQCCVNVATADRYCYQGYCSMSGSPVRHCE